VRLHGKYHRAAKNTLKFALMGALIFHALRTRRTPVVPPRPPRSRVRGRVMLKKLLSCLNQASVQAGEDSDIAVGKGRINISPFLNKAKSLLNDTHWDGEPKPLSLDELFKALLAIACNAVTAYEKDAGTKYTWARGLKKCAIVLGTLGLLCPLVAGIAGVPSWVTSVGYMLLAVAAALAGADTVFGLSNGRARCIATQLALKDMMVRSTLEWMANRPKLIKPVSSPSQKDPTDDAFELLKTFASSLFDTLRGEEQAWETDLRKRLQEFQNKLNSHNPHPTPSGEIKGSHNSGT